MVGALVAALSASAASADFQYRQTNTVTGGAMFGMVRFAGAFVRKGHDPLQPSTATVIVKGNRMASLRADTENIIDLMALPEILKGMAEVAQEASKLNGVPMASAMTMNGNSVPADFEQVDPQQMRRGRR
ncbi:MAG: hypothetical protein ACRD9L_16110 [Bryobacteraceae bacterium]